MLGIFDTLGNVRADLDTMSAEIEALDDTKRSKLFAVVAADTALREVADKLALIQATVHQRVNDHSNALDTANRLNPPVTHQQALLDAIAAQSGNVKPSPDIALKALADKVATLEKRTRAASKEDKGAIETELRAARKELAIAEQPRKAKAALEAAVIALTQAQAELTAVKRELKDTENVKGAAIVAWIAANQDGAPTHLDLVRNAAKADADRALAAKAQEPPQKGPHVFPLEKVMVARGKQKSPRTYFPR